VRWHGQGRVERFLRSLYEEGKAASPDSLFTYVNFPPTEFLDLSFLDICSFNVYLHREHELRAYLARLQHIAGQKPFLLAEAGADSIREGEAHQAEITSMHIRAAFEEGACGAIAFAWTDEWWRGGHPVEDWNFGLVDRDRRLKPAALAVASAFDSAPFSSARQRTWPKISVVVCAYNAADTLADCLASLERLTYPDYEIILVNDGSKDRTSEIGRSFARVRVIDTPNAGLSAARNVGLAEATGDIVAYTDADTRVLVQTQKPLGSPRGAIVMVHGLEGSGEAGYMRTMSYAALQAGYIAHRFHMRTCGGTEHLTKTLYHGGLTGDLLAVLRQWESAGQTPVHLVGYSLGGNLVRYWGEDRASQVMPVRAWVDEGALIAAGSDCNVSFFDPLLSIWGLVTRGTRTVGVQGPESRVDI